MLMLGRLPRSTQPELLDLAALDGKALRLNLREMAMLNRLPGGVRASVTAVERLAGADSEGSVLDVGTGSGDFVRHLRRRGRRPVIASDSDRAVLDIAAEAIGHLPEVEVLHADVRALPLPNRAVAVAHASLVLHHLDPPDAVTAFREMRRVARHGVVINDLQRTRRAWLLTGAAVLTLARSPVTRHDGILSVRRAYTPSEMDDLAHVAGLRPVARTATWWPRITTTYR